MPDVRRVATLHGRLETPTLHVPGRSGALVASGNHSITAAAQLVTEMERYRPLWYETWQEEAWDFYESLGEFNYGVEWFSEALSRVRLTAARVTPGGDEPEIIDEGPAAELVKKFMGGVDGHSQLLRSIAVQLSVAGDGYFVGRQVSEDDIRYGLLMDAEPDEDGNVWTVHPTNTLRRNRGRFFNFSRKSERRYLWEMQLDENVWVPLGPESLVVRIWDRNEHYPWRAMSPAKAALPIMREIDMYNRHIIASLVSRVAMNGMLFIPDEVTLPASPQYENASDPFIAEMLDIMMSAIKNPGSPAAAAPMPVRIPAEYIDRFKHLTFASGIDGKVFESRAEAIRRLAATLNLPAEIITGMGDTNHWCVDSSTEILTKDRGWVTREQLNVGDVVRTLNHVTGLAEWQPVLDKAEFNVVDLEMIRIQGKFHDSLTTLEHRWPVLRDGEAAWTTSGQLRNGDYILRSAPASDLPRIAKYDDAFVELVGWFVTEGTCTWPAPDHCQVRIGQSHKANPQHVTRIRRVLTDLFGPAVEKMRVKGEGRFSVVPRWREVREERGMTLFHLNKAAFTPLLDVMETPRSKIMSREFIYDLTESQLNVLLNVCGLGDGHIRRTGGVLVGQRDSERLAPIELAGILAGRPVKTSVRPSGGFVVRDQTYVSVSPSTGDATHSYERVKVRGKMSRETYTGVVWCPVTQNTTWLARRNGQVFFTGNSSWQLTEDAIKIHISPKVEIITRALTLGYLHPMLRAMGEDTRESDGSRIIVWYDTSELTQRPDRSGSAITLREMMIISDAATRRETGFDESDAPTDQELEKMILMKLATNPQTAAPALKELTGLEFETQPAAPPAGSTEEAGAVTDEVIEVGQPEADMPDTQGEPPPSPDEGIAQLTAAARRDAVMRRVRQSRRSTLTASRRGR